MRTGSDVHCEGHYLSECCRYHVTFAKHQTFTRCPICGDLTVWEVLAEDDLNQAA